MALGIETDLVAPLPREAFEAKRAALAAYLQARLRLTADGAACALGEPAVNYESLPEDLELLVPFDCPAAVRALVVDYGLFFDIDSSHRALGKVVSPAGQEEFLIDAGLTRAVFSVADPSAPAAQAWPERLLRLILLGAEHILIGFDHVLFLLALLVSATGLWPLVKLVTAFTLAHSLTLGLAWFGLVELPGRLVESAIALSIAYVALENMLGRHRGRRWPVAGLFGLVHGLGFYGVLSELELARESATLTLVGFNLGVELGQLAIVALAYPGLYWAMQQAWYDKAMRAASLPILLLALWWLIERALPGVASLTATVGAGA